jgi:YD repeat-containing protein
MVAKLEFVVGALIAVILPIAAKSAETTRYQYDAKGRLTKAYRETGPAAGTLAVMAHDKADNRTRYTIKNVVLQLGPGQSIQSADGRFQLVMQGDGNLVLYQGSQALWVTPGTWGTTNTAAFQTDGNFVVYGPSGPLWASSTYAPGAEIALQNDGNLVIYAMNGSAVWASGTSGH